MASAADRIASPVNLPASAPSGPKAGRLFLKVANRADRPLLLLDENRILNTTVLVDAHTEVTIPVSCVEQGS